MFNATVEFVRQVYGTNESIPLHAPSFHGREKEYLAKCIDSTFVSYVGEFVAKFEDRIKKYTGAKFALSTANGTLALHLSLVLSGVDADDEVLIPALTFVATANAISHCGATPILLDSEGKTLGLSPSCLEGFLHDNAYMKDDGYCYNRRTGKRIAACVPVHILGHPARVDDISRICHRYGIAVIEDAAESLGSVYKDTHTGLFGKMGVFSFNGNKTITTGGGGVLVTDDEKISARAAHIATTAKRPHPFEFYHDEVGYNYRLPNVNAAIGYAQMEYLDVIIDKKRTLAKEYKSFFANTDFEFVDEPVHCRSNFWLNAIIAKDRAERDTFLEFTNKHNVMTRPLWMLMNKLPMYSNCQCSNLSTASQLEDTVVCLPSSPPF